MDNQTHEVLSILQEESAEIIQAVSKIFRFGIDTQWKGQTNREQLEEELGDVLAMIDILCATNIVDLDKLKIAKHAKLEKLKLWSSITLVPKTDDLHAYDDERLVSIFDKASK